MSKPSIIVRRLGRVAYPETAERMRRFTAERGSDTPDELWLLEHMPVYTLGVRARNRLPRVENGVPVVLTDRGGDITYHGPGQPVIYTLLDLTRRRLSIHALVRDLEQAVIDVLKELGVSGDRRKNAPGVYVADAKIAALGLRVRGGRSYHGLAFNASLDLTPFHAIDPCGYAGLNVTQLADWRPEIDATEAGEQLLAEVRRRLAYNNDSMHPETANDVAYRPDVRR